MCLSKTSKLLLSLLLALPCVFLLFSGTSKAYDVAGVNWTSVDNYTPTNFPATMRSGFLATTSADQVFNEITVTGIGAQYAGGGGTYWLTLQDGYGNILASSTEKNAADLTVYPVTATTSFYFTPYNLLAGHDYYFVLRKNSTWPISMPTLISGGNRYGFANCNGTCTESGEPYKKLATFLNYNVTIETLNSASSTVEIIDPALYTGLCASTPCAKLINTPKYCYYDRADLCTLDFQYNSLASMSNAYIVNRGGLPPGYDTKYLPYAETANTSYDLVFDNPGVATSSSYDLFLDIIQNGYGGYRLGHYSIEWAAYCDIDNNCPVNDTLGFSLANCDCNDVATSTGIFDEFRYGVQCGGKMLACWLFTPAPSAFNSIKLTYSEISDKYPLNIITGLQAFAASSSMATSSPALITLTGLPPALNGLNGVQLLNLNDLNTNVTAPLIAIVRTVLVFILRVLMVIYIIRRIIEMGGSSIGEIFGVAEHDADVFEKETKKYLKSQKKGDPEPAYPNKEFLKYLRAKRGNNYR